MLFRSAETSEGTVGYDMFGNNNYLDHCYQDKFSIGIKLNNNNSTFVNDFFDYHYPNTYGKHYSIYNTGTQMNSLVRGLTATFNDATENYIYEGPLKTSELSVGCLEKIVLRRKNLHLGTKDLGLCSALCSGIKSYTDTTTDWNYVRGSGIYGASNFGDNAPPISVARYGILVVESCPWIVKSNGNSYGVVIQKYIPQLQGQAVESKVVYYRTFFGDESTELGTKWSNWTKATLTEMT